MKKKERAEFDAALRKATLLGALRWTELVKPDLSPPTDGSLVKGFLFNSYEPCVKPACTNSIFHAFGRNDKTTSQGSLPLYSTRLLALKALRNEIERESAEKLMKIDAMITKEQP